MSRYEHRVDALAGTWRVWGSAGQSLTDDGWTTATRCPGWDVAALYAHHSLLPVAIAAGPPPPGGQSSGEPIDAAGLLRRFNAPGGVATTFAPAVAEQAVREAAANDRGSLVERFTVTAPAAVDLLRTADPDMVVPWPGADTGIRLAEAVRVILLEATVHLLDVQRALGQEPAVPGSALRCTVQLLAELPPAVELIEAATGRSATSPLPVLR